MTEWPTTGASNHTRPSVDVAGSMGESIKRCAPTGLSEQRFKAIKGFVTNTIMFVIALALFGWHWHWLRRPAP